MLRAPRRGESSHWTGRRHKRTTGMQKKRPAAVHAAVEAAMAMEMMVVVTTTMTMHREELFFVHRRATRHDGRRRRHAHPYARAYAHAHAHAPRRPLYDKSFIYLAYPSQSARTVSSTRRTRLSYPDAVYLLLNYYYLRR